MNIDDATVMAYLDGELDDAGIARVDAEMARDPALAARIARQQQLDLRVRGAHAAAVDEPVPDALRQFVLSGAMAATKTAPLLEQHASGQVVRFPARRRVRGIATHLTALAAGIVLAVIALPWLRGADEGNWRQGADGLQASGALAAALEDRLANDPAGRVQVALSFRDGDGRYCRAFRLGQAKTAGLACRDAQGWSLPVLARDGESTQGALRQAASPLPAAVLDAVDARIQGDALDAAGEQAARNAGWR